MLPSITVARIAVVATLLIAPALPASAADSSNFQLFQKVESQVLKYPFYSVFDSVHARINDGVVELTGKVTMPYKKSAIAERVGKVDGVTRVIDKIAILPVSQFDDQLRIRIARAIYANPNFFGYGSRVNPPIHVIVERGRVTLEGVVNNNVDRRIAESIASGFPAFKFTNDLKTAEEAKQELERL